MVGKEAQGKNSLSSTTTTTEPPAFVAIMADVGRFHPRMRPWFLRRYYENPAGFELTAEESWEGRNPPGLFYSKLKVGMHLEATSERARPAVCPACERGGGYHLEGCTLAPGSRNRQESAE
jgi:hypothetical protein